MHNDTILGSHNAWSYLKPRKWWMKLIRFTARCLKYDIKTQYEKYGARCFDLRFRFDKDGIPMIVHGPIVYEEYDFTKDLKWLNDKKDAIIRVLLDTRSEKAYTEHQKTCYKECCKQLESCFPQIRFTNGCNLYNGEMDYDFGNNITMEELYSSVCPPKIIDDWIPILYAKLHNKENIARGTDKDVLLIDFVNIQ